MLFNYEVWQCCGFFGFVFSRPSGEGHRRSLLAWEERRAVREEMIPGGKEAGRELDRFRDGPRETTAAISTGFRIRRPQH